MGTTAEQRAGDTGAGAGSLPAIEGWFTAGDQPALLGGRCTTCGTFTFPRREGLCPNPRCSGLDVEQVELSRRGTVWSYATNHYDPPPPSVVSAPYTVVAVTLATEAITILGLLDDEADPADLRVGSAVELVVADLHVDDDGVTRTVWKWRPAPDVELAPAQVAQR